MVTAEDDRFQGRGDFVWILGYAGLISAADNWIVAPVLPSVAAGIHVSIPQASAILTAYMIPYGFMQPVHGYFSERRGRAWLLHRLVLGLALGTLGCALSPSLFLLCAFRFVTGFFAAGLIAVSLAFIGDHAPPTLRHTYVGRFMGIVFCGQGVSIGLGGLLAQYISWRIIFLLFAVAALSANIFLRRLPEDSIARSQLNFAAQMKAALGTRAACTIYTLALATGFLLLGIYSFAGSYLQKPGGLDPLKAGGLVMFFGFACLVAGRRAGRLSAAVSQKGTILIGSALAISSPLLFAVSSNWKAGWLAIVALGMGYVLIQSTLATLAFDVGLNGVSSALVGLGLFGGGGIGTFVGGTILANHGYRALWPLFGVGTAVLFVVVSTPAMKLSFSQTTKIT